METIESFANRVLAHTGLSLADIPDAPPEVQLGGSIACARGGATVVLVDHAHQDANGTDWYRRAVMVGRTPDLPPASAGATGKIVGAPIAFSAADLGQRYGDRNPWGVGFSGDDNGARFVRHFFPDGFTVAPGPVPAVFLDAFSRPGAPDVRGVFRRTAMAHQRYALVSAWMEGQGSSQRWEASIVWHVATMAPAEVLDWLAVAPLGYRW